MSGEGFPASFEGIPITLRGGSGVEWLYRFFGEEGLMYVGITRTGVKRFEGHRKDKGWWPFVNRIEVECFPTRAEVRFAECEAIYAERPAFNIADRGAHAAQAAHENEKRRELLEELWRQRATNERLKAENKRLRAAFKSGMRERSEVEALLGENVVQFVPRHLLPRTAA